jgi:nucleoside-diphosphate-sugar epimerase
LKIAVTGASGFIGQHVIAALQRRSIVPTRVYRAPPTEHAANETAVMLDVHQPPHDAFDVIGRPDVLIHLAWGGLPNYKSLHHFEQELPAHYRFLKGLIAAGLQSLLVVGTCFEYGMQSGALSEEREARPCNPYGFAKDVLRRELQYLQQSKPFQLTWARLFYPFGDGQAAGSLWPQLKLAVQRGDKTFNMSGGEQLRDYLSVTAMAEALAALACAGRGHGVVNVCSGAPISVRRLVEGWIAQHGWSIELNLGHYPYPDYEPMAFWGDRRKLDACIGSSST